MIDEVDTEHDDLIIEQSKPEAKIEEYKSRKKVYWRALKSLVVQRYPFTRLREQDLISLSKILGVHYGGNQHDFNNQSHCILDVGQPCANHDTKQDVSPKVKKWL